jgi:hypothetical protein
MCTHCTRREFLGAGAIGALAIASGHLAGPAEAGQSAPEEIESTTSRIKICVLVAGAPGEKSWALSESDLEPILKRLAKAEKTIGDVELVIGRARNAAEATKLLDRSGPDAPVLLVSCDIFGPSRVVPAVFEAGRPVAMFHMPIIGGHDWCLVKPWQDEGRRITLLNTTDLDDLERAVRLLRTIPVLRRSRVLVSPPFKGTKAAHTPALVKQTLGVEMLAIPDGRYDEVMNTTDFDGGAEVLAKQWMGDAKQMVEPTKEDVVKAARASLTLDQLIRENDAAGLCVGSCMRWLKRGFPCLGFTRLNDNGIPAACDGDMDCLLTMLIAQHALGRPGFLGNAGGVDTSRNVFHLSHCSAPLKMEGPEGKPAPFLLRRHAEVKGGAVPEVHYRVGQTLTFTKLIHLKTLLVFTGKIVEVPEVPKGKERGCRTELVAEISDAEKLLANWGADRLGESASDYYASLHRVAYYGDHTSSLRHLGHLMGLEVRMEC